MKKEKLLNIVNAHVLSYPIIIPKKIASDKSLSYEAKGFFLTALTHDINWLIDQYQNSKPKIKKIIDELIKYELIEMKEETK